MTDAWWHKVYLITFLHPGTESGRCEVATEEPVQQLDTVPTGKATEHRRTWLTVYGKLKQNGQGRKGVEWSNYRNYWRYN